MPHHFFDTWCAKYDSSEANRGELWSIYCTTCVKCDFVPVPDLQCIWCALCTPHRGIKIIVQSGLLFVIFCYIKQFSLDTWSTSWLLFEYEDIVQNRLASGANNVSPLYIGPCIIMIFLGCMYEYVRRKVGIYCRVKIACGKRIITHYENSKAHPTGVFLWICLNDISLGRSSASLAGLILLGINIDISYLDWA
jgi:hypothetical protein